MRTEFVRLALTLSDGEVPSEFRLFASGANQTAKGVFVFDARAAELVAEAYRAHGVELCLDYDHRTFDVSGPPESGKAAGWFALEVRDGALWAVNVRWTPPAAQALMNREWRYISPAFACEPAGDGQLRVVRIINAALTNLPATVGASPLMAASEFSGVRGDAQKETVAMTMKTTLFALGLPEATTDAELLAAVRPYRDATERILALTGKPTASEALGTVEAWKAAAAQVDELTAKLGTLARERVESEVQSMLGAARAEGRVVPAEEPSLRAKGLDDPEWLRGYLTAKPRVVETTAPREPATSSSDTQAWEKLSPIERHNLYVHDREKYEAMRAACAG